MEYHPSNIKELCALFAQTPSELEKNYAQAIEEVKKDLEVIYSIKPEEKTFKNTFSTLDAAKGEIMKWIYFSEVPFFVSPDRKVQETCQKIKSSSEQALVELIDNNFQLYKACKEYIEKNKSNEKLTEIQKYFIKDIMRKFKKNGLDLPKEQQQKVTTVRKEIAAQCVELNNNINLDHSKIEVKEKDLTGLQPEFIKNIPRNEKGLCVLGCDYPTYFTVMPQCSNEEVRKKLYIAFNNRAYPENKKVIENIIAKRDELGSLLGYKSYAAFEIDGEMAQTPENVYDFLDDLVNKAQKKLKQEIDLLKNDLPKDISLTKDGKLNPWDLLYISRRYKKKHFDIDEEKIAEYFPAEHTIAKLVETYEKFFDLKITEEKTDCLWDKEVKAFRVCKDGGKTFVGYLLLDLYPRTNKASHGYCCDAIAVETDGNTIKPGVAIIITNFTKATADKPSLFKRSDIQTLFHEMGHCFHVLLTETPFLSMTGFRVKQDFAELPSQMLEEWMFNKEILRDISCHYKTGKHLPEKTIDTLLELKRFGTGLFIIGQSNLCYFALELFKHGQKKDIEKIEKELHKNLMSDIAYCKEAHHYASFLHLELYGARYYGYLWTKVFALDLFDFIDSKNGLRDPKFGKFYAKTILAHGGEKDPEEMLVEFLGRKPNNKAFLKDLGL
ncbi:Zn-dependent oligopeptidase [bacterium]|nr:Zn-dependent oligopeptidase [bacterium]